MSKASEKTKDRKLSHEELTEHIRKGAMFPPSTPGLMEAAREVLRPMIEHLEGREILCDNHVLELARVEYVEVNEEEFRIVATHIKYIDTNRGLMFAPGYEPMGLRDFGGCWKFWYLRRAGIKPMMSGSIVFLDPTFVAAVKTAVDRGATPDEIFAIVFPEAIPTKETK